jgi:hypothetical protein
VQECAGTGAFNAWDHETFCKATYVLLDKKLMPRINEGLAGSAMECRSVLTILSKVRLVPIACMRHPG